MKLREITALSQPSFSLPLINVEERKGPALDLHYYSSKKKIVSANAEII
jgi:hypothetical protein